MAFDAEFRLSRSIRALVDGLAIGDPVRASPLLREVFDQFEWYLPDVLRQIHTEWRYESLDGIDAICWLECRLGETRRGAMARLAQDSLGKELGKLDALRTNPDAIDWTYKVAFGERR